jgi:N-acetylneuraminate epimerase
MLSSCIVSALLLCTRPATIRAQPPELTWGSLPDLPVPLSGHFAGIVKDRLVIVGGAHFPTPLFEGGEKVWESAVYSIKPGEPEWTKVGHFPRPVAYGASVTWRGHLLVCIGGGDAERHYRDTTLALPMSIMASAPAGTKELMWEDILPPLPKPCAFSSAALIDDRVYVAGGQEAPDSTEAMSNFWRLCVADPTILGWEELDPWPGPARILPVAASANGAFYLFSGCELFPGDDGKARRRYLRDGYRYRPGQGWEKLADMPRPAVAAPTPAPVIGDRHVLILGGDDGENADRVWELKDKHPGFHHDILAYDTLMDRWETAGNIPHALVTTTTVPMPYGFVVPGGEDRPGHRSAEVMRAKPAREDGG